MLREKNSEKATWNGSNYMTTWKKQKYRNNRKNSDCQGPKAGRKDGQVEHRALSRQGKTILRSAGVPDTWHHAKPAELQNTLGKPRTVS